MPSKSQFNVPGSMPGGLSAFQRRTLSLRLSSGPTALSLSPDLLCFWGQFQAERVLSLCLSPLPDSSYSSSFLVSLSSSDTGKPEMNDDGAVEGGEEVWEALLLGNLCFSRLCHLVISMISAAFLIKFVERRVL